MAKSKQKSTKIFLPSFAAEATYWDSGTNYVVGFDEAGRGCLAGPVSAAAFLWEKNTSPSAIPESLQDSKQLSEAQRDALFGPVLEASPYHAQSFASVTEIDQWNILQATCLAMARSLERLLQKVVTIYDESALQPKFFAFLIDGKLPLMSRVKFLVHHQDLASEFPLSQKLLHATFQETCLVKGDQKSFSIAAASILAKVVRDRHMLELNESFPQYAFASHKGYSTPSHRSLLEEHGPCSEHRTSFAPVRSLLSPAQL